MRKRKDLLIFASNDILTFLIIGVVGSIIYTVKK